jgi:hypothetical protein
LEFREDQKDAIIASSGKSKSFITPLHFHFDSHIERADNSRCQQCDQTTPHCTTCLKSKRLCTGYKRKLVYVISRDVKADTLQLASDDTAIQHHGRWRKTHKATAARDQKEAAPFQASSQDADDGICSTLGRLISDVPALRQQYHYLFNQVHLPFDMLGSNAQQRLGCRADFLVFLTGAAVNTQLLESCMFAFFAARVGRANGDTDLIQRSRSMYVSGLAQLQEALAHRRTRLSDETLAACLTLSFYELAEHTEGMQAAYMTHRQGALMLLKLRGPKGSETPLGHSLFLAMRSQMVICPLCLVIRPHL